jgi:cytochrome c oxidase subunit I+III
MEGAPGLLWPMVALALGVASWLLTIAAREANGAGRIGLARTALLAGICASGAGVFAGLAGPWLSGLDPTAHSYPAIVWTLAIWTSLHAAVAVIMQAYALARSLFGRMDAHHDADIRNVTVYMYFFALTAVVAYATIGLFPEAA